MAQQSEAAKPHFSSGALYVGDLESTVSEAQIFDMFNTIAPVVSIRICRDAVSKRSLGYAYVNYSTPIEATAALEALNFTPVNGKNIRIMFSSRDPSTRKSGSGNVFVKNLDRSVDNKALHEFFAPYGKILSCKVAVDGFNMSKGYGFVQFDTDEAAQNAIDKVNGMTLRDKQLYAAPFIRRQERDSAASKFNNVFVKNLPETTSDDDLKQLFGEFGPISSAVIMKEPCGKSKMFGFVNFESADDASLAVEALNGKLFEEKELYVARAQKKTEREAELKAKYEQETDDHGINLYLKNLDDSIDDPKLSIMFSEFGSVTSCKVMRDPHGHSKGSGFVSFADRDSANRALVSMNGRMIGTKPLYVAEAQKKEERKAKLEAQFSSRPQMYGPPMGMGMYHPPPPMFHQPIQVTPQYIPGNRPIYYRQNQQILHDRAPPLHSMQQQHFHRASTHLPAPRAAPVMRGDRLPLGGLASALASSTPEHQRTLLGEHLYPLVDSLDHGHAGKITGMLLEMDQTEILHLLESPEELKAKVSEAAEVLDQANRSFMNAGISSLQLTTA